MTRTKMISLLTVALVMLTLSSAVSAVRASAVTLPSINQVCTGDALGVPGELPPSKTDKTRDLIGLSARDIRSVLNRMKQEWQVSSTEALLAENRTAAHKSVYPARQRAGQRMNQDDLKQVKNAILDSDPPPGKVKSRSEAIQFLVGKTGLSKSRVESVFDAALNAARSEKPTLRWPSS